MNIEEYTKERETDRKRFKDLADTSFHLRDSEVKMLEEQRDYWYNQYMMLFDSYLKIISKKEVK